MGIIDPKNIIPFINFHHNGETMYVNIQSIEGVKRDDKKSYIFLNTNEDPVKVDESVDFVIDYCERMGFHIKEIKM